MQLFVNAAGQWVAAVNGEVRLAGIDSALATGGALATGKVGILDFNNDATVCTRTFDNFSAWVPVVDAVAFASQSVELTTQGILREDASGTAYGPVSWVEGDLPRIPPSGQEARTLEVFLKGSRGDLDSLPDSGIDDISARFHYRPSWVTVPDS